MACFISAGHHNKDSGAIGVDGRKESEEAIKLRDAVVKYCKEKGLKVITDDDDETLAQYLTRIQTGDGSVVLEFHFDAFDKIASGTTALVSFFIVTENVLNFSFAGLIKISLTLFLIFLFFEMI